MRWRDAPADYGPPKKIYNRFIRWSRLGVFNKIFSALSAMLGALPRAKTLLGDRGYDADWFRKVLAERNIAACIPSKRNRKIQISHDAELYR